MGRTNTGMSISIYYRVVQLLICFQYFSPMGPSHGFSSSLSGAILFGCILLKSVYRKYLDKKVVYRAILYLQLCQWRAQRMKRECGRPVPAGTELLVSLRRVDALASTTSTDCTVYGMRVSHFYYLRRLPTN